MCHDPLFADDLVVEDEHGGRSVISGDGVALSDPLKIAIIALRRVKDMSLGPVGLGGLPYFQVACEALREMGFDE